MLHYIPDSDIERFIEEDVPYGDLTTHLLNIGGKRGKIIYATREETTLCCTEEAARLLDKVGAHTTRMFPSGTFVPPGTEFLEAEGTAEVLHSGWKAALNLLEYASGVASRTARIVKAARIGQSRNNGRDDTQVFSRHKKNCHQGYHGRWGSPPPAGAFRDNPYFQTAHGLHGWS